jgi:hypothetical protein
MLVELNNAAGNCATLAFGLNVALETRLYKSGWRQFSSDIDFKTKGEALYNALLSPRIYLDLEDGESWDKCSLSISKLKIKRGSSDVRAEIVELKDGSFDIVIVYSVFDDDLGDYNLDLEMRGVHSNHEDLSAVINWAASLGIKFVK